MTISRSEKVAGQAGQASGAETPDILVFPPLVSVVAPIASVLLEFVLPLNVLPAAGALLPTAIGIALLLGSGALAVSATKTFGAAETNVDPRQPALHLVRTGPFRFTRNPMYLAMVMLQFGLALTFSLDWALFGRVLVFAILHFGVVLREEAYLRGRFGEPYQSYLDETRRWL